MTDTRTSPEPVIAILALGSNVGEKRDNIARAATNMGSLDGVEIVKRSRDYRTPPWGNTDQDWFVNACMSISTTLSPSELLARCLETERKMGRERGMKWGPRVIDLDILTYGDAVSRESDLVVPHPYITKRAFVLAPMAEVAPDLVLDGKTILQWRDGVSCEGIEPFE